MGNIDYIPRCVFQSRLADALGEEHGWDEFRTRFPVEAGKVDNDTGLPNAVTVAFWRDVDNWDGIVPIEEHVQQCCIRANFSGNKVALLRGENLGTSQQPTSIANAVASPKTLDPTHAPPPLRHEAERWLRGIASTVDATSALTEFKRLFGSFRLRNHRIFAFRNPDNPRNPLGVPNLDIHFRQLAIPGANPADYLMLAYEPDGADEVRQPTALDAGNDLRNLEMFEPGGYTRPEGGLDGVPEVVTTPPLGRQVTVPPRQIR